MYHVRLKHGAGHSNAYVTVTREKPDAYLEDKAAAKYCVDGGFFELIEDKPVTEIPNTPADPIPDNTAASDEPAAASDPIPTSSAPVNNSDAEDAVDDDEQLETMTVAELRNYAEIQGIDLNGATKKAEIIACIKVAENSGN